MLMLDWTEDAPVAGCSCELLPTENDDRAYAQLPSPDATTAPAVVGPGSARVFRLLRPSARLACSAECGTVAISAVGDADEWVSAQDGVVGVNVCGCADGKGAPAFFSSHAAFGGADSNAAVHALRLRATPAAMPATTPTLPRAAAALLFVGLNAAAAAASA